MRIKKKQTSVGILGKILNSKSNSKQDTYSANYIDNNVGGGIIESITNDKGTAIKFADGTMICRAERTVDNITVNRTWGSLLVSNQITGFLFPEKFIDTPIVVMDMFCTQDSTWLIDGSVYNTVDRTKSFYICSAVNSGAARSYVISFIAIGRWK